MKIILADINIDVCNAWHRYCPPSDIVEQIYHGSILDIKADAVVSPANSFGFMDGGIDLVYRNYFGLEIELRLQQRIKHHHHGELLVGTVTYLITNRGQPNLIIAPTMRVPSNIRHTVNVYLATRAALLEVEWELWDEIQTVAFPGMGTGIGQVDPEICARQMRAAIGDVLLEEAPTEPKDILKRHRWMLGADASMSVRRAFGGREE